MGEVPLSIIEPMRRQGTSPLHHYEPTMQKGLQKSEVIGEHVEMHNVQHQSQDLDDRTRAATKIGPSLCRNKTKADKKSQD